VRLWRGEARFEFYFQNFDTTVRVPKLLDGA